MTKKVKRIGCSNLKDLIEEGRLDLCDEETIIELSTFEAKGSSYEATNGHHDDLVMNLVMFGYFVSTPFFQSLTDIDLRQMLHAENMRMIEDDVIPFGFIDDGTEDGEMWAGTSMSSSSW